MCTWVGNIVYVYMSREYSICVLEYKHHQVDVDFLKISHTRGALVRFTKLIHVKKANESFVIS